MSYAPTPAPMADERTLAVLGNLAIGRGFLSMRQTTYSLIITDRRLVFAELTKEMLNQLMTQARDQAKGQGEGFLGQWGAQLMAPGGFHERYRQIPAQMALLETPGNFAIDRAAIQKVKFKTGSTDDTHATQDEVVIKTPDEKIKLIVRGSLSVVRDAFRTAGVA